MISERGRGLVHHRPENILTEDDLKIRNLALAAIEHRLFGSGTGVGNIGDIDKLLGRYVDGDCELGPSLFTPLLLLEGQEDAERVERVREKMAKVRWLRGEYFACLAPEASRQAIEQEHTFYMIPAPIDYDTHQIIPVWDIGVLNRGGEVVTDPQILGTLQLNPRMQDYAKLRDGIDCKKLVIGR